MAEQAATAKAESTGEEISPFKKFLTWILGGGGALILILILMAATNPNMEDFQAHYETVLWERANRDGGIGHGIQAVLSPVTSAIVSNLQCDRTNCLFFSVFTIHSTRDRSYVGAFGRIWGFDASDT